MAALLEEVFVAKKIRRRDSRGAGRTRVYTDPGTPQLRARRLVATGSADIPHDYPLDIMLARGVINKAEHEAGWTFARNRWLAFGPPPGSVDSHYRRALQEPLERKPSLKERMEARVFYEADIERIVSRATDWALHEVMRAAVYLERPRWLRAMIDEEPLSQLQFREMREFQAGLRAITYRRVTRAA